MYSKSFESILDIVRRTEDPLRAKFGNIEVTKNKGTRGTDVLTELDLQTEDFLRQELEKFDPTAGFYGEERGKTGNPDRFWLVDPIDGTAHFVRGTPFVTTMVALVDKGEVVFSVINRFVEQEMYVAEKGKGAYRNGEAIRVSSRPLDQAYISHEINLNKGNNLEKFMRLREKYIMFNTITAGYEFALIASGKTEGRVLFDAYGNDWDFAPGALLVAEAGGIVKNLATGTYTYQDKSFIAATPHVFEDIQKTLADIS